MVATQDIEYGIVANSNSKIYHDKDCYCVPQILEKHKVNIDLAHYDEKGRSYRPCSKCLGETKENFNNRDMGLFDKGQSILEADSNNCLNNIIKQIDDESEAVYNIAWNRGKESTVEEAL